MQVDAVHVSGGQERQGGSGNAQLDKGKGSNSVKGKGKERRQEQGERRETSRQVRRRMQVLREEGAQERRMQEVQADLAASRCDKSGKPTSVNSLAATSGTRPEAAHRARLDPQSRWQSVAAANQNLIHRHERTSPADSPGRKIGRCGVRSVGFWIQLDILSDQLRRRLSTAANTRQSSDFEQRYRTQRGVLWSETSWISPRELRNTCGDMARHECDELDYLH